MEPIFNKDIENNLNDFAERLFCHGIREKTAKVFLTQAKPDMPPEE